MSVPFKLTRQWILGLVLSLSCLGWYALVLSQEGNWIPEKFGLFKGQIGHGLLATLLVALGAVPFGLLFRETCSKRLCHGMLLGYALLLGWLFGNSSLLAEVRGGPDFFLILLLSLSLSLFAVLYNYVGKAVPLWPLLLVPGALALASAFITSNISMVLGLVFLGFSFNAIGGTLLSWAKLDTGATRPIRAATGMAFVIILFRIVGPLGGAGPGIVIAAMLALTLIASRALREDGRAFAAWLTEKRSFTYVEWAMLGFGSALAFVYWLNVTTPEIGPDAIGGRAALPMLWARDGAIHAMPEIFLSYMGIGGEILNLIFYPFSGECVAKCSTYLSALLLVLLISSAATTKTRWVALSCCLLFFSSTLLSWQFVHGFVDLHVAMFCLATLYCYDAWYKTQAKAWLLAAGLLVGTAISIKLNAGTVLVLLGGLLLFGPAPTAGTWKERLRLLGLFALGSAIALLPSILRTLWLTGNPIFPFANGIFQSPLADLKLKAYLYGSEVNASSLLLPFKMVLEPMKYAELGTFHPFFFGFALLAALNLYKPNTPHRLAWFAALVLWAGWLVTEQNARYAIPALAMTAYAICRMPSDEETPLRLSHWFVYTMILLGFAINLARPTGWVWCQGHKSRPGLAHKYLRGEETAAEYKVWYLPTFRLAEIVNQTFGSKSVVWEVPVVRDHLSFRGRTISYPHAAVSVLKPFDSILPLNALASDREACQRVLAEQGVTHIVWDEGNPYVYHWPESKWQSVFNIEFSEKNLKLIAASGSLRLYQRLNIPASPVYKTEILSSRKWDPSFSVSPGELIGIRLDWDRKLAENCSIDMVWSSNDDRIVWYERLYFPFETPVGWHRHWQSTPPGASTLKLYISEGCWPARPKLLRSITK